jgi:hypothetical protein
MSRPSHPPCFQHHNNTGRRVQTMQLLIMQFSPTRGGFREITSSVNWLEFRKQRIVEYFHSIVVIPMLSFE